MNKTIPLTLGLLGGLLGSAVIHYVAPPLAFAQDQLPAAREIRTQSVALVDQDNALVGVFTTERQPGGIGRVEPDSKARAPRRVVLRDATGHVIWAADNRAKLMPLSAK